MRQLSAAHVHRSEAQLAVQQATHEWRTWVSTTLDRVASM